jgi:7-dehydrocholesterol reductase
MSNVYVEVESSWGRRSKATWTASLGALFIIVFVVCWVGTNWVALEYYGGSLRSVAQAALKQGLVSFTIQHAARPTMRASIGYLTWVIFQAFLYSYLPGKLSYGQLTPAGNLLQYTTNGLLAWTITHVAFAVATFTGIIDPAIIAKNWEGLLVAVNIYGLLLAAFCQIKAYVAPSHPQDRKFTGSIIFDYFCGIELNPRIGDWWDFKLFYNGRPGIIAWTLMYGASPSCHHFTNRPVTSHGWHISTKLLDT